MKDLAKMPELAREAVYRRVIHRHGERAKSPLFPPNRLFLGGVPAVVQEVVV